MRRKIEAGFKAKAALEAFKPKFCIRNQVLSGKGAVNLTNLLNKPFSQGLLFTATDLL